jgi:hypothetical protein
MKKDEAGAPREKNGFFTRSRGLHSPQVVESKSMAVKKKRRKV